MTIDGHYAPPWIRDAFLCALDGKSNDAEVVRLARGLTNCSNPLPGMTCELLSLPMGSSYAEAAARVLVARVPPADAANDS